MSVWDHIDSSGGPTACWPWTGSMHSEGYGRHGRRFAHVLVCEEQHGQLPARVVVRHLCAERSTRRCGASPHDDRRCCNPAHLVPGTERENALDRERAKRGQRNPDRRWW